jgi:hypothetical protein
MRPYQITTLATTAFGDLDFTVHGPGFGPNGHRYVLGNRAAADAFVDALNAAYAAGMKDGMETGRMEIQTRRSTSGA